ncbi:AAA family ATPase [Nocardia sp. NBC_01730]|uniref:ATP-binding protein n=1 Tax=Nocardia sp. NBC_01730 TaxID=2975998 RepID=UPI002E116D92|nr:AAA family ATPase [Nocardia sp. NBC_01730]
MGNLPASAHNFVGRDRELERISTLLVGSARLITLTGAGGIGKTRLAAEAVGRFAKAGAGAGAGEMRVYWVRLARLAAGSDTVALEEEIAHAVIEADFSGRSAADALVDRLTRTDSTGGVPRTVLVLDNCEHVLAGVALVTADLLDAVPELTVVATSREPLGWADEYLITVPPLPRQHALMLFRHRAELTGHTITGTDQTTMAAAICRHVNNHPLYIELASARLRHQPLAMILQGLTGHADDTRLRWSRGPSVGTEPRHRAVTDVIAWSYNLCSDKERLLFDRLSVFAAGYATNPDDIDADVALDVGADLEAIEAICSDDENTDSDNSATDDDGGSPGVVLARHEIGELLERLVDQSLVSVHMTPTTVRYSLLESLRVFAQQRLRHRPTAEIDEPSRLGDRHRRYYHDKIAYAAVHWSGPEGQNLLEWARAAWANILIAIETSIASPCQAEAGLEICLGLTALQAVGVGGAIGEHRRWTQRCLDATRTSTPQPTDLQIGAMATIALLAALQGCDEDAERMLEDCVAACIPDPDTRRNWRHTAESDIGLPAPAEFAWGAELLYVHLDARAVTALTRARDKFDALGNYVAASRTESSAAVAAGLLGTSHQALEISRRCYDRASVSGAPWDKSWAELGLAIALTKHGDPAEALAVGRSSLAYQLAAGDAYVGWMVVEMRAWSLARLITDAVAAGNPDHTRLVAVATEIAHLTGGVKTLRARLGINLAQMRPYAEESDKAVAVARRLLGSDAYAAAETRGSRLRPEHNEVQRLALGTLSVDTPPVKATTSHWHGLTPAEQQVAILATAGWTNPEIAARRGKSARTIDAQMAAIRRKLAISSREEIIEHIPKDTIDQVRTETIRRPHRNGWKPPPPHPPPPPPPPR